MKKIITWIVFISFYGNAYGLEIRIDSKPGEEVTEKGGVWFGWVEASRAYSKESKETVIEFYCHKLKLADEKTKIEKGQIIYVLPRTEADSHFVATIRSPELTLEKAENFLTQMQPTTHFCHYPNGVVTFDGLFGEKSAPFLSGDLIVTDNYRVEDIE